MFEQSPIRSKMETEIAVRSELSTQDWQSTTDIAFASNVLELIEKSAEWPHGKLRPTDAVTYVFHGKHESDLAFARFSTDFQRLYNVRLPLGLVTTGLDLTNATIEDFVLFLYAHVMRSRCR